MSDLKLGEHDLLAYLRPDSFVGAIAYLVLFVGAALVLSRALRAAVHAAMTRKGHIDLTTVSFLQQIATALIWIMVLILYAHLIPVLRSMGTALLAGVSVASVVIGLAAQSTLGNLVAGLIAGEFDANNVAAMPGQYMHIVYFSVGLGAVLLILSRPVKKLMGNVQ